ncbi:MAG: hypothetical protein JKY62_16695 [Desulfocapsa sp.]|nr:hypothetical protein [Desulfocapsa sp.]
MLKALQFVKGSIASKGFDPTLMHFRIENGHIKGFNGSLALSSPIELDLDVSPKAIPFVKAITACKATTVMHVTPTGKLSIKSGKFKAFVECAPDEAYPEIKPEGKIIPLKGSFIETLKKLQPFMAEDASRPWARGILLKGQSAFVTNNIIIIEAWMERPFPVEVNIPASAIKELVRIKEEPTHIQLDERSASFLYEDGRWLRTNLNTGEWPDITPVLNRECDPKPLAEGFFEALIDIAPFAEETSMVMFINGAICTHKDEGLGASAEVDGLPEEGAFNHKYLSKLEGLAEKIDLTLYPTPCIFYGDKLRGAIVGMKL